MQFHHCTELTTECEKKIRLSAIFTFVNKEELDKGDLFYFHIENKNVSHVIKVIFKVD